ncbi:MAG: hypothetical protein A3H69_03380 [Candidatus Sungbacteria bacterium RIFCSPLOWO2_02_FULL_47_9]|uniref:NIF system FeS cluster assembly NifU C-terminal domain-containing protein n=1 Tax=Candidatus Sungbacteria bacterium RIFCSPHIGHO2_01_FULL_47_32 TaxID=1802264 RepID=A0A1G2KB47_9BACT|nr:MAG: Nitrogen-fixing NifU domain-containing protein [Parcubacteria group bacterium GW2011_GWA2_47_10]OGZ95741.1 MAG: hypothetical protein A2633_00390 [Candidatus Sungbacteria bacterium RIFCSPHIGHO2_01_FULL_47_32]OGZ99058.1 MAG: hypothetical protein A3D57_03315 [Candidatus Sungbacteria bacterium RIFCSPHIGHO2_02_FULL_46_12]OHA09219.1 MAG: hypothetical protein A3H69_03380 [Candidatus Sungbacteria bacterium RIFCSPLOWO2_02_FULL_47_9]
MESEIEKALEEIRPMLAMHHGNVEFVKFDAGTVFVRLLGTCNGCVLSQLTLKSGIEDLLRERVEGVISVEAV